MTVIVKPKPGAPIKPGVPASAKPPVQLIAPTGAVAPKVAAPAAKAAVKKLVGKQPEATVTKEFADGSQIEEKIPVGDPVLTEEHATVGVSMAFTKQIVQYEPFKASVSLFMPCAPNTDAIEETYAFAKGWVDGKVQEIADEINAQLEA